MVGITLENITKRFGDVVAVDHVNLEVRDKEFVVLLGPSGCGKTTILNVIAGLEHQDEGNIYIGDELVNQVPPDKRDVAMVFQSYALYPHMKAFDNIAFPLKIRKTPKQEITKKVSQAADMLRITHILRRKPYQMSGGERQRVALARAIVRDPKAFLLDEPLSNLDAKLRVSTRSELKKLHEELQTTFVYVTHDQVEALTLADRVALINYGRLQQYNTPDNIYDHPVNTFVAGFIGSPPMNFIDCTLVRKEKKTLLESGAFPLTIPEDIGKIIEGKATTPELILGIRPGNIAISKEKSTPESIKAEVYLLEPIGEDVIIDLKVGKEILKAIGPRVIKVSVAEKVWINFDMNKIHIFDKKTEESIL